MQDKLPAHQGPLSRLEIHLTSFQTKSQVNVKVKVKVKPRQTTSNDFVEV